MDRAYSILEIKSLDEEQRVIEGVATAATPDRLEDIVESEGAEFKLPLPFLWQHDRTKPIGHVTQAKVSKDHISVRVQLEKDDEPGPLKDLLDLAWRSIKKGLVRGLSIGFRPIDDPEPIKGTYGLRFKTWEWLELSAVTIPAHAAASIAAVKSYDRPAASGNGRSLQSPGVSGTVKLQPRAREGTVDVNENIKTLESSRETKAARLAAIADVAAKEGRTKNESEQQEHDELVADVKALDRELADAKDLQRIMGQAKPVDGNGTQKAADSRDTRIAVVHAPKPEPGIEFARYAMCVAAAKGDQRMVLDLMETHYPQHPVLPVLKQARQAGTSVERLLEPYAKAAVPAGTTAGTYWANPLLAYNTFSGDFIEYLRSRTIIGQFGQNGIPSLRRIPFNVHIKGQTSGGTGYWVGQGLPKPLTSFNFSDTTHYWYKVAAISVITEELIRFSDPSAERLVRDGLAGCLIERVDTDFVATSKTLVANVSPASITNGAATSVSAGTDGDGVRTDIKALLAATVAANYPLQDVVFITTPMIALGLSMMTSTIGAKEFPQMTVNGGRLEGFPVIVSNYVAEGLFIMVYASEIYLSDDGTVTIDASREASLEMLDASLLQDATGSTAATSLVSMYQTDSVALRAHRYINWSKRRALACAYLTDCDWGQAVS